MRPQSIGDHKMVITVSKRQTQLLFMGKPSSAETMPGSTVLFQCVLCGAEEETEEQLAKRSCLRSNG